MRVEEQPIKVLDDGFLHLVDIMGSDESIEESARVSYGIGTRSRSDTRTLLRYLMRHHHTTPFEMAEMRFRIRIPMDAWRQMIRHRTANVNEYSTRYSEAIDSAQKTDPDAWRLQSKVNKQGSAGDVVTDFPEDWEHYLYDDNAGEYLSRRERLFQIAARDIYEERLKFGVAKEVARKDLPLSTYTEAYWKSDLHNIFNYLRLRMDSHAQLEIRSYANAMATMVEKYFPLAYEAFNDYILNATTLTLPEIKVMRGEESMESLTKREQEEYKAKTKILFGEAQ